MYQSFIFLKGILERHLKKPDRTLVRKTSQVDSLQFALYYPEMVDKLVILNVPHPSVLPKLMATSSEQRLKSWLVSVNKRP